jgi:NAD(P)-dependent dehydrogenase (short-subunit alcohol dehydrogenase family)
VATPTPSGGSVVIVGVGEGLGTAQARRFASAGLRVALTARKPDLIEPLARELNGKAYVVDAADAGQMAKLFADTEADLAPVACAICNISDRLQKPFLEMTADEFERSIRINGMAAFLTASEAAKRMVPRGSGSIFFTGNHSSRTAIARLAANALVKGGVKHMATGLHRELGSKGIHIAHFTIDGGIDNPKTRRRDPSLVEKAGLVDMDALAELYYQTHMQHKSCWSLEVECRPWTEPY